MTQAAYRTPEALALLCEYARPMGAGYICQCPLHDDSSASLKISEGDKATVLWCHAGCATTTILEQWGIGPEELFYDYDPSSTSGKAELRMELASLKRILDPPPPLPATIVGLMSEAFSLPQPWHDTGLDAALDCIGSDVAPHIALRRRQMTRDVECKAYFQPWCDDQGMSGTKLMQYAEWGVKRLTEYWRERQNAQ